jgi:uncharacterized membrane protein YoaK (UPF0700 family)
VIDKLPRWVWAGGAALAFIAGVINAVGLLDFRHQAMTHMTGTTTLVGVAIAETNAGEILQLAGIVLAFVVGASLSGAIIGTSVLRLGRRYGVVLALESLLLFCAVPLLQAHADAGIYLATCACGLQNAMASTYSGAVLRTTHVSGIVTDLGIALGQRLRGHKVDSKRVRLYALLFTAFLFGGIAGAAAFARFAEATLYGPAALVGIVGIAYTIYRHRMGPLTHRV